MVATSDLGSDAERRGGSSPFVRTKSDCHLAVAFLRPKGLAKQSFATPFIFTIPPNLPLRREAYGKCPTCSPSVNTYYQHSALALLTAVRVNLCYFLCPGPSGNQPLRTRSRCCITSKMLQKEEKDTTPSIVDHIRWLTITEAIPKSTPAIANNIQLLIPT